MSGPAVTVVPSGGLPVKQVTSGAPAMTFKASGGIAVTLSNTGTPFILEGYGGGEVTPAPVFSVQPSITPTSGNVGDTFTADNGTSNNTTSTTRSWRLDGVEIGTGATVAPATAGSLVLRVIATGAGGSTVANSVAVTVAAAVPVGALDPAITPPILTLAVGPTTYPPQFDVALDGTVAVGDTLVLTQYSDVRATVVVNTFENTIDSGEAGAGAASFTGLSAVTSGTYYWDVYVRQPDNDYSARSSLVLHGEVADVTPDAFAFTDVAVAPLSTVQESNTVTLSGFNQPVPISISGGEYAVNAGSGFGAWTSAAGTAYPGDLVKVRHTSSGSYATNTNTTLTAGGVSDTFTTTSEAAPVVDVNPPGSPIFYVEAKETSTLFQSNAGTTAVAADGDPVGYWADQSGAGFHMTAVANDTTRPTYRIIAGKRYVRLDGVNDYLRRAAALGLYSGGACTVGFAVIANPAISETLFGEGSTSATNPHYQFMSNNGTPSRAAMQIRNDANTAPLGNVSNLGSNAYNNTARRLIFVDTGSQVTLYIDGVAQTPVAYTRAGTLTLNVTGIGAWPRATPINYFEADLAGIVAYSGVLSDITGLDDYLGSLL